MAKARKKLIWIAFFWDTEFKVSDNLSEILVVEDVWNQSLIADSFRTQLGVLWNLNRAESLKPCNR